MFEMSSRQCLKESLCCVDKRGQRPLRLYSCEGKTFSSNRGSVRVYLLLINWACGRLVNTVPAEIKKKIITIVIIVNITNAVFCCLGTRCFPPPLDCASMLCCNKQPKSTAQSELRFLGSCFFQYLAEVCSPSVLETLLALKYMPK